MSFLQKYGTIILGFKLYSKILMIFRDDCINFTLYKLKEELLTFIA